MRHLHTILLAPLLALLALAWTAPHARAQSAGSVVQWGDVSGTAPPSTGSYIAIAAGERHSLALRADGSLVQWGGTSLNQAANAPAASERFTAIAAGLNHSLALRTDGSLVQWGDTVSGQTANAPAPTDRFRTIAANGAYSLALRSDGSLVLWGNPGQVAINAPASTERFMAVAAGVNHCLALRTDGSLVQWGQTSGGSTNNMPASLDRFVAIAVGRRHNLALRADGSLVQWGDTLFNQALNAPSASERFIAIAASNDNSLALRADGSLVIWGPPLGVPFVYTPPPATGPYTALAASNLVCLALRSNLSADVSFTYQGRLTGQSGPVDLQFDLFSASTGGTQLGATTAVSGVTPDAQGLFSAAVAPGTIEGSGPLWLEVRVAEAGTGTFTTLTPRQAVTRTPQATFANRAATAQVADTAQTVWWSGIKGIPANVTGVFSPWEQSSRGITFNVAGPTGNVGIGALAPTNIKLQVTANTNDGLYVHTANESPWALRIGNDIATAAGFQTGMYMTNSGFFRVTNRIFNPNGTYAQLGTNGAWTALSDARLKTDITTAEGNLAAALKLRPVNFRWKGDGAEDFGLIAQEVRAVLPKLVTGDERTDSLTLNYSQLSVVAIGAIQEQQRELEALRTRNQAMEAELEAIKAQLRALQAPTKP